MRKKFGPPSVTDANDFNICALGQLQISSLLHRFVDIGICVVALDGAKNAPEEVPVGETTQVVFFGWQVLA